MKRVALLLVTAALCSAQNHLDHAKPFPQFAYLPGTCDFGQVIVRSDLSVGSNVFICGLTNNWVAFGATSIDRAGLPVIYSSDLNDQTNTPSLTPGDTVVDVASNSFTDESSATSTSTINVGQTVSWKWVSGLHVVVSLSAHCSADPCDSLEDQRFDSGDPTSTVGHRFAYTFTQAGTYHYYCDVHGAMMQGAVVVNPPSSVTASGTSCTITAITNGIITAATCSP